MTYDQAVSTCLTKYVVFRGRAPRSEYWWFVVFLTLSSFILSALDARIFPTPDTLPGTDEFVDLASGPLATIYFYATLLPSLAVTVRRLHDVNWSAWWFIVLNMAPWPMLAAWLMFSDNPEGSTLTWWIVTYCLLGAITIFIVTVFRGTKGSNRFGPDPLVQPEPVYGPAESGAAASDAHLGIDR